MHYLSHFHQDIDRRAITTVHEQRQRWVNQKKKGFLRYRRPFEQLSTRRANHIDCTADTVTIGRAEEVTDLERDNNTYKMTVRSDIDKVIKKVASHKVQSMTVETFSLEELFLAMYGDETPSETDDENGGGEV